MGFEIRSVRLCQMLMLLRTNGRGVDEVEAIEGKVSHM